MTTLLQTTDTDYIDTEPFINGSGVGQTGLTVTLTIKRLSDGNWWNGSAFQAGSSSVTMTEVDSSNQPGVYRYSFNPQAETQVYYKAVTSTATVVNRIQVGTASFGGYTDNIDVEVSSIEETMRAFGLSQLNEEVRRLNQAVQGLTLEVRRAL